MNVVASFQLANRRIEALRQARSLSPRFSLEDALAGFSKGQLAHSQRLSNCGCSEVLPLRIIASIVVGHANTWLSRYSRLVCTRFRAERVVKEHAIGNARLAWTGTTLVPR
jgi:hypothetical protein